MNKTQTAKIDETRREMLTLALKNTFTIMNYSMEDYEQRSIEDEIINILRENNLLITGWENETYEAIERMFVHYGLVDTLDGFEA